MKIYKSHLKQMIKEEFYKIMENTGSTDIKTTIEDTVKEMAEGEVSPEEMEEIVSQVESRLVQMIPDEVEYVLQNM